MSEVTDAETKSYSQAIDKLLTEVYRVAEVARVSGIKEPLLRGSEFAWHSWDGFVVAGRELRHGYFLVLAYSDTDGLNPDPFTRAGLKDCQAWILKYDRHYSRWSVEAWNKSIGDRAFSQLAPRLLSD